MGTIKINAGICGMVMKDKKTSRRTGSRSRFVWYETAALDKIPTVLEFLEALCVICVREKNEGFYITSLDTTSLNKVRLLHNARYRTVGTVKAKHLQ
jgi:hypothetical protein